MALIERDQNQAPLPLRADPAAGALVGTFLLALCMGGPAGLVVVLIVWIVFEAGGRWLTHRQPNVGADFAARSPKG